MKAIVIGAGVIGMMQARELAQQGLDVILVDKGACGAEASWAGGGIISPLYPWRYTEPVTALASWSQAYYPNLIQTLEAESDIDSELTRHGLLMLNVEDKEAALTWSKSAEPWLEPIDREAIYQLESGLRTGFDDALWMPQVGSIRNPRLLRALRTMLEREQAVEIREESAIVGFNTAGARITGVKTIRGDVLEGDVVLVCSGAWSQDLAGGDAIDIRPVKGQMIRFAARPGIVSRIVLNNGQYVIPRRDGSVIAGSTLEYTGFDKQTTEHAKNALADMAIDLFPDLASCPISDHWSGLRPASPTGVPYVGLLPEYDNVYINAGHFRNGLVLAPASVHLLTAIICKQTLPLDPEPYQPQPLSVHL